MNILQVVSLLAAQWPNYHGLTGNGLLGGCYNCEQILLSLFFLIKLGTFFFKSSAASSRPSHRLMIEALSTEAHHLPKLNALCITFPFASLYFFVPTLLTKFL